MQNKEKKLKTNNFLQIGALVLIVILTIAIIVEIFVIVDYKNKIDEYTQKQEELSGVQEQTDCEFVSYELNIERQML